MRYPGAAGTRIAMINIFFNCYISQKHHTFLQSLFPLPDIQRLRTEKGMGTVWIPAKGKDLRIPKNCRGKMCRKLIQDKDVLRMKRDQAFLGSQRDGFSAVGCS